jgi:GNAT superfamily N-acetyltransferase
LRIYTFDEVPAELEDERLLVHLAALGGSLGRDRVEIWQRRTRALAEYVGLFAIEGGHVLGQTLVRRMTYTFGDGPAPVSGIASVGVRPDHARRGVARRLLEEAHRREREAGQRDIFLWTNGSWGAHRLYESLGYRDLYPAPWAALVPRGTVRPRRPGRLRVRPARSTELARIEALRERWSAARTGFTPRPRGSFAASAEAREIDPEHEILVAEARGALEGYAHARGDAHRILCGELVALDPSADSALLARLETVAGRRVLAFRNSVVDEQRRELDRRGYARLSTGWWTLMGTPLERTLGARAARRRYGADDPRFLCHSGDQF